MAVFSKQSETSETAITTALNNDQSGGLEEPKVVEVNADENLTADPTSNHELSKHILSYPLVKETYDLIEEIPGVKVVISNAQPVAEFIHSQPLLKPVIKTLDNAGNSTLNSIDSVAPGLQTATYKSVGQAFQEPFIQASTAIKSGVTYVNETVENNVVSPTIQLTHDAREFYNKKVYNTNGKPLLRSSIDPIVKPYNTFIESFTEKNFPNGEPVAKNFPSEFDRKFQLDLNLIQRAIPVISNKVHNVFWAPYNYGVHVVDVFHNNYSKTQNKSIVTLVKAVYNSKTILASEAWDNTIGSAISIVLGSEEKTEPELKIQSDKPTVEVIINSSVETAN
ncbi:hypothetical protein WICMUC_001520 [Wickerhamomyces mucosus]|uniref:Uncharacterized protein n=1 Tax=Wickerhamomyces mucosus TaxID=1378264 RepID=A0A9P8PUB8_9ASCO|nr:hypothetical protein WICMUC_001520 [Wickerhamomyces mucosus]